MEAFEIVIRPYDSATDDPYIYSTWTKYAWYSGNLIYLPKKQWFADKIKEIKETLEKGTTKVACFKNTPYVIAGYIVVRDGAIQWRCVKKDYHYQGIDELLTKSVEGLLNGKRTDDGIQSQPDSEKALGSGDTGLPS